MLIHKTYYTEVDPTDVQLTLLKKHVGCARFAYNWGVAEARRLYEEENIYSSGYDLNKRFNAIKKEQFPWTSELSSRATKNPLLNVGVAYKNFFASVSGKRKGAFVGPPTFKKKGSCENSVRVVR